MLPHKKYTPADFLDIARKRAALIIGPLVLGLFVALVVSSQLPDVYEAETLIQIVPQRVPDSYVRSTVTIQTENRLDALGQQVLSRTQLERMILDLNLYPKERTLQPMQDVVEKMRLDVSVQPVRPSRAEPVDAFYLRFKYGDPVIAVRVVERLGTLYIDYNARERGALAEGANEFLEAQLVDSKARLEEQDRKLQLFRERHSGRLPSQLQSNMQAIQSTQMQRQAVVESLARDRDRKLMLERLYNDALNEPAVARQAPPVSGDPTAVAAMPVAQQLEIARNALARMELRLKEGHPDLKRARRQVADLEKQVAAGPAAPGAASPGAPTGVGAAPAATTEELQRRDRLSALRAEIESLDRQILFKDSEERRLSAVINDYQNRIEAVPGVESEWLSLTRDYDTLQASFKDLLSKSEAAKVAADLENRQVGEQFRVLDAPRVPLRPISPMRPLISAAGLGAGLVLGLLLVAFLELRDSTFKTESEVEQILQLPVIALIPALNTSADQARERRRRLALASVAMVGAVAGGYVVWALQLWKFVA